MIAAQNGHNDVVELLLKKNANVHHKNVVCKFVKENKIYNIIMYVAGYIY